MKSQYPLVLVYWVDSVQPQGAWTFLCDVKPGGIVVCASVGWLIEDSRKCKRLAPNMAAISDPEEIQVSGIITIPAKCVLRTVVIKQAKVVRSAIA